MSFRLLAMLAVSPPPQMQPALQAELAELVHASLGDPLFYRASVDQTLLPAAAARADVAVPASSVVDSKDAALDFAAVHGYPVVVKRPFTTASDGVRIVANAPELATAIADLATPKLDDLEPDASRRVLVQKHIDGHICYQNVAAWQGRTLCGYGGDGLQTHGNVITPGTVIRFRHAPELRRFTERLVQALGMNGLFTSEYMIERTTGQPYLIEIHRRISSSTHFGSDMNVDLCAALHAAMHGQPLPTRTGLDPNEEYMFVPFPAEWLRDARSHWLRDYPVDVPWDDPELLEAMLALRRPR